MRKFPDKFLVLVAQFASLYLAATVEIGLPGPAIEWVGTTLK